MAEMNQTKRAKIMLYHALLQKDPDTLTDTEIEIGYQLSKDAEIQQVFERAKIGGIR